MLLQKENALILGAGGAIGSAVARRLTAEGVHVCRPIGHRRFLRAWPPSLMRPGEHADGTDEPAVSPWLDRVAREAGASMWCSTPLARGQTTLTMHAVHDHSVRAVCDVPEPDRGLAIPHRAGRGSAHGAPRTGAIVFLSASLTGQFIPYMSGINSACGAVEALSRTLATEFGPAGVRVNCVHAGGMPETRTIGETAATLAATMGVETDEAAHSAAIKVLRRPLRLEETAAPVAWVASEMASGVAGQIVNVCGGAIVSR